MSKTKSGMTEQAIFLKEFPEALAEGTAAIFVGAGVSMAAGYPSWKELLREIAEELGISSDDVQDLAALAQWHIRKRSSATKIREVISSEIGIHRPIPAALEVLARLPVRHYWTTNYDTLVERAFEAINRPITAISSAKDLSLKVRAGSSRLYKMHGTVNVLSDVVISTDDYELFRSKRGAFLPLLQSHLSTLSMLFVGLSFTDPNVRHVLSLIRETFPEEAPEHFAIVRPPQRKDFSSDDAHQARLTQHDLWADDLKRYGLKAIEIDDYEQVPELLRELEMKLAQRRVHISGSWPISDARTEFIHSVAQSLGEGVGDLGLTLVTGSGLIVGSAAISGFLTSLQQTGSWDLDRRLIARPFPQPLEGKQPDRGQWQLLRQELGRLAGIAIFIGGQKIVDGKTVIADGVLAERDIAVENNAFLLPIGATGGSADRIANDLLGGHTKIKKTRRPTDDELKALADPTKPPSELASIALKIIKRASSAS